MTEDEEIMQQVHGRVKWFDPTKGFGFIVSEHADSDILLHANVLRNFGQGSVADGAGIVVRVQRTQRGVQAVEVVRIDPPEGAVFPLGEEAGHLVGDDILALEMEPARVKWFDKAKGSGFANVFAQKADVFLHIEVLRHSGFSDLAVGEAIALRVVDGRRGMMAAQILSWERAAAEARMVYPGGAAALAKLRLVAGAV